uniref:Uncharacterized protein n=1 Tax=Lutzomyia longipalpis TaxID=7200 RepID=A0A1B0CFB0_LUTLO
MTLISKNGAIPRNQNRQQQPQMQQQQSSSSGTSSSSVSPENMNRGPMQPAARTLLYSELFHAEVQRKRNAARAATMEQHIRAIFVDFDDTS